MRVIVLALTALALSLSACKVDAPQGFGDPVLALATTAKACRDPLGRFAKCQTCPDGSRIWIGATCPAPKPAPCPAGTQLSSAGHCEPIPAPAPEPTPTPTPVPTPSFLIDLAAEGDSITAGYKNYIQAYQAAHPELKIQSFAVGGSGLTQIEARLPTLLAAKPAKVSVLIGANETPNQAFHDRLMVYVGKVRASGAAVYVGTLLPQQDAASAFNLERPGENSRIRNDAATKGYKVIDFAADSAFATWSAALFTDYVHPNEAGQQRLFLTFKAAMDGGSVPAPVPSTGWEPSPSLDGVVPIASNFDISTGLQATAIPVSAKPDVVGAFRFICQAGQLLRDDPIVYPGQPGKSHLHQFYGNTAANAASTYSSLRQTGDSTCGKPLNLSAYWMPAMLDGKGNVVRPDFVSIYYKRRPKTDPLCNRLPGTAWGVQGICANLPNGLKFIFGYDMLTGKAPTGFLWYNCNNTKYDNLEQAQAACPVGAPIGAIIEAPDCWDGKNLDSPNHRDHVAYAGYGDWGYFKCPSTHPYVIPAFTLGAWFTNTGTNTGGGWRLSSDEMVPTLPRGTTFHADFWMAWDPTVHAMWEDNCLDLLLNCSAGVLGNGKQIVDAWLRTDTRPKVVPIP